MKVKKDKKIKLKQTALLLFLLCLVIVVPTVIFLGSKNSAAEATKMVKHGSVVEPGQGLAIPKSAVEPEQGSAIEVKSASKLDAPDMYIDSVDALYRANFPHF